MRRRNLTCAQCGKKVPRNNGFFRSYPDPVSLHHDCVRAYSRAGHRVTGVGKGKAEVYWDA